GPKELSAEQIAVCAGALEDDGFVFKFVDEQPVRFDMAFLTFGIWPDHRMISQAGVESLFSDQLFHDTAQLAEVFPSFSSPRHVLLEAVGADRVPHQMSRSMNSSSAVSKCPRFLPSAVSRKVFSVSRLGNSTAKGRPLRSSTWRRKRVIA